jgi:hypothetical protein
LSSHRSNEEMIFSEDRSINDCVDAAVDDLSLQGIKCLIRTYNFVKESTVEDYSTVDRASETCFKQLRAY